MKLITIMAAAIAFFHVHLLKSAPAANDTVQMAPKTVELWFNEAPEAAVSSIKLQRVAGSDSVRIPTSAVHRDPKEANAILVDVTGSVSAGNYVVDWKTTAPDGHPSTGTIPFTVR